MIRRVRLDRAAGRLVTEEVAAPRPAAGQVAVGVAYAGVNLKDVKQRSGAATVSGAEVVFPGFEVAGHVVAVGAGVEDLQPGDAVVARPREAGFADVAVARRELVVPIRRDDDDALRRATATFIAGTTAMLLLEELARARAGESLLVHGAAGAVGTALGQLAAHLGLQPVIGTVGSEAKVAFAAANGYPHVVLRDTMTDAVRRLTDGRGVDLVADPLGGEVRRQSFELLAPLGRLLAYGRTGTDDEGLPPGQQLRRSNRAFLGMSFGALSQQEPDRCARVAERVVALVGEGRLGVPVYDVYDLDDIDSAMDALESRVTTGKILLSMGDTRR